MLGRRMDSCPGLLGQGKILRIISFKTLVFGFRLGVQYFLEARELKESFLQ